MTLTELIAKWRKEAVRLSGQTGANDWYAGNLAGQGYALDQCSNQLALALASQWLDKPDSEGTWIIETDGHLCLVGIRNQAELRLHTEYESSLGSKWRKVEFPV